MAGPPDMQALLAQVQLLQQELADARVEGSAGGGLVTATVSGTGELQGLAIDPKAADPDDTETLADLILAAVRDATGNAQRLQAEKMGPLAQGLPGAGGGLPGLPGM